MNFDDYKNTKDYPNKESYTKYKIVSDDYQQKIDEYNQESYRLEQKFIQDLKDEVTDFDNECIFRKVYAKAYADGHGGGFLEIYNHFVYLVDFVEDILSCVE
jgi:hypothetical protein